MSASDVPIEDLLIHADFVRGLARDLVGDEAGAEDLAQEAWVRVLEQPPRHGTSLRGWFATVLQNLLHNRRRSDHRRMARERAIAEPPPAPSPEHILERELVREKLVREKLVRAVLRLDEPFRTAVLLRYYEELPTRAIAERLEVPHATVRTRIARGLARLRADLEGQGPGLGAQSRGRQVWAPALIGWAAARPSAAATPPILGTLAMKKLAATLAVLLVLAVGIGVAVWPKPDPAPTSGSLTAPGVAAAADQHRSAETGERSTSDAARRAADPTADAIDVVAAPTFPADRGFGSVHGFLVDENGSPMPDVGIRAEPLHGTLPPGARLRDDRTARPTTVTDARGAFRLERVPGGPTRIRAVLEPARRASRDVIVTDGGHEGPVTLRARRGDIGDDVAIRVLDQDARPVAGALVEVFVWSGDERRDEPRTDPTTEPLCSGRTDDEGRFAVRGRALRSGVVFASTGLGPVGRSPIEIDGRGSGPSPYEVVVRLQPPGRLRGRLTGIDPTRLEDAVVSAYALRQQGIHWGGTRRFDAPVRDGAFALEDLPAGLYGFTLRAPGRIRLVAKAWGHDGTEPVDNSALMTVAAVPSGDETDIQLEVADAACLRGRVHSGGRPIAGATIRAVYAPRTANHPSGFVLRGVHVWRLDRSWENCPSDPMTHVTTTTDAQGQYELPNLQPGVHRVEAIAPGYVLDRRTRVPVAEGETVELDHDLPAAGVLQVAGLDLGYVGVTRAGDTDALQIAIANREFVTFWGLPEGDYDVHRFHSNPSVDLRFLGRAHVDAGRTTWLDLRAASVGGVLTGRVTAAGEAAAGAAIQRVSASTRTDAFGAFRLENAHPFALGAGLAASPLQVTHGGVRSSWILPGEGIAAAVEMPIDLGAHRLTIEATDASGRPTAVRLEVGYDDWQAMSGCCGVRIEGTVPPEGRTFGPLPPFALEGRAVFADGYAAQVRIPADATRFRIEADRTALLRVTVRRQGKPLKGLHVYAFRWKGEGAPPADDAAVFANSENHHGKTDADGTVEIRVPFGHYLVTDNAMFGPSDARRILVDASEERLEIDLQ